MAKEYEYAGLAERFAAYLLDTLVRLLPMGLIFLVFNYLALANRSIGLYYLGILGMLAAYFIYYSLMEGLKGQTVGKMALGIMVVGYDGKPIGIGRALVRNALRMVDGFILYLIGGILVLTTVKKQRLGDMAASDVVIKVRPAAGKFKPGA